jgi:hypothetical protein
MKNLLILVLIIAAMACTEQKTERTTKLSIENEKILINGSPTLEGATYKGIDMEGLLPNSRMVQGIFDDLNPVTDSMWQYPDTGEWDAERNTREFVAAMPSWREHGLLGFTINLQGGSPQGYSGYQPWHNSAFDSTGVLRENYLKRLEKIMDKSDELGMVTILGLYYFGQDERLTGDEAVKQGIKNTIDWLVEQGYQNVMIEIANECNTRKYEIPAIKEDRVAELITFAQDYSKEKGFAYPVSVSFNGNTLPPPHIVEMVDYVLLHGNGVNDPDRITEMVDIVRSMPEYSPKPIIFNEDDHYNYDQEKNNMLAAFKAGASWGYFDFRREGEEFEAGFQSVPVDWSISHERKREFFGELEKIR